MIWGISSAVELSCQVKVRNKPLVGGSTPSSSTTKRDVWHVYITGKTGAADSKQNYDKRRGSDDGWDEPERDSLDYLLSRRNRKAVAPTKAVR